MTRSASFYRKIAYIVAIAVLLVPLSRLSAPAVISSQGNNPGGALAQLRTQYDLSQAELGEIDPASETMKLATLGLRGVAVNWLWMNANHYKKVKDYDRLNTTVQQIIRLQPNFLHVWDFQAHNLSYNVSVEFDDYRYRYEWVKKGIAFLIQGTHYNRDEPGLLNQVGWYVGQKIGRSDEQKSFRRLFREDRDFHEVFRANGVEVDTPLAYDPRDNKPDNWFVARLWYNKANDAVVNLGRPIRGKAPLLFYNGAPMSLINGASALEKDGVFEGIQSYWEQAGYEWYGGDGKSEQRYAGVVYGNRPIPHSRGFDIRLNDAEPIREQMAQRSEELKKLAPGVFERLTQERKDALPEKHRLALDVPEEKRTSDEYLLAYEAQQRIAVSFGEVAEAAPPANRAAARLLADQLQDSVARVEAIDGDRRIINFTYWRTRCRAEQRPEVIAARKNVYQADQWLDRGSGFDEARKQYESAWLTWQKTFVDFPDLMENVEAEELIDSISSYRDLLGQQNETLPPDFVLNNMLDKHQSGRQLRETARVLNQSGGSKPKPESGAPEKPASEKPAVEKPPAKPEPPRPPAEEDEPAPPKPVAGKIDDAKPAKPEPPKPPAEE